MSNPTATSSVSFGTKFVRFFVRLLVTLVVAGLTALVVYLLSKENERTFTLHVVEDTLIIHKGKFLPFGSKRWEPEDKAYAPFPLENLQTNDIENSKYSDIIQLDNALFAILEALAKPRLLSEDSTSQERGIYYLSRAEQLKNLSAEQQNTLKTLRAEVSFLLVRAQLADAERAFQKTMEQLKLATQTPNRNTQAAAYALHILEPALRLLHSAIQEALAERPAGRTPQETPAAPAGAPPAESSAPPAEPPPSQTQENEV